MKYVLKPLIISMIVWFTGNHNCYIKAQEITEKLNSLDYVRFKKGKNDFILSQNGKIPSIVISSKDFAGVKKVAELVQQDLLEVTQIKTKLIEDKLPSDKEIIIAGTLGKNELIDQLINEKKINIDDIKGRWENSLIEVVDKPFPNIEKALVIIGSDKRGTIYGLFDLSRRIGVSPWHWWADVPAQKHKSIYIKSGRYNLGEPKVKYRGIFLNDEEPCLGRWAVSRYGGFNHKFYEKVFELILRLKGNYLWPAMWWASFNSDDAENPKLADEMGIVMSTSHHEPMMRAHEEWTPYRNKGDKWNFATNPDGLKKFWKEGIERMGNYESVVTLAMRGDGDEAMEKDANISLLERIVKEQRIILGQVTGKPVEQIPQVWALYKEVQDYYEKGMRVPEDVTLLLCDDNWGNVRKLPKLTDPPRSGGYGMYYHFDYVGGPRNYKWLNTNQISRIWEQMNLTYQYGVNRIWIVNVGDLKPMELPISFFLDYAWNPESWPISRMDEYTMFWAKEQFGEKNSNEIAEILKLYTQNNSRRKPEMLNLETYNLLNYREFENINNDYKQLADRTEKLNEKISPDQKDAFYELVYHPVAACSNLNEMYYSLALNRLYEKQGRAATNDMAQKVKDLFKQDTLITKYYNTSIANGKWNHMMAQTHISYTIWQQPDKDVVPLVKELDIPQEAKMGIAIEGSDKSWPNDQSPAELPVYDSYNKQSFYIEIFNCGKTPFKYHVSPSQNWVLLSKSNGLLEKQERIEVQIDWDKLNKGVNNADIEIKQENGNSIKVYLKAIKYNEDIKKQNVGFIERNGYVSIEAQDYSNAINNDSIKWEIIPGLGRTISGVTAMPVTRKIVKPGASSPMLEYKFYLFQNPKDGKVKVKVYLCPTLNFQGGEGLQYGVSIDDEPLQLINMHEGTKVPDWKYPQWWNQAVSENIIIKTSEHNITNSGAHVLKFWRVDPGVVLQKLVIDNGGLKPSYLGPPETAVEFAK